MLSKSHLLWIDLPHSPTVVTNDCQAPSGQIPGEAVSEQRIEISPNLLLVTDSKSYMSVRLVRNSISLNDLEV